MTRERPGKPRARMFVALDLPQRTRFALAAWGRELLELRPRELRAMPEPSLHVTLAFLGYRYLREVDAIAEHIERVAASPVDVVFEQALMPRPTRGPRLYAAAVAAADELAELRARLASGLEADRLYTDEPRAYWPHVTLCRVKSSVRRHRVIEQLPGAAPELREPAHAPSVTLYRSELRPEGAQYTALHSVQLPYRPGG
jgi:2'-5' RNA ligase